MSSLNSAFTQLGMRRRYESWFHRFELADKSGAWWLRYLLTNPGRAGCPGDGASPVQVWATWFPRGAKPQTMIGQFAVNQLRISGRNAPLVWQAGPNELHESSCRGELAQEGNAVSWNLRYRSNFGATLSNKGWIGFSRTPHSDATFSGEICFNGKTLRSEQLGAGLQGHNCGFRHRNFWTWMHACFPQPDGRLTTFEALVYEMPLGLVFRKAILWHEGRSYIFGKLRESRRDPKAMSWMFHAFSGAVTAEMEIDGGGPSLHRLPYTRTNCNGAFEVANNSLARAQLRLHWNKPSRSEEFVTDGGSVLEMTGEY
jgi:hypothetical protein